MATGYLPAETLRAVEPRLEKVGAEAISPRIREWSADAERNQPYVRSYDVWGARYPVDRLVTAEGWKQLGRWGAANGFVLWFVQVLWPGLMVLVQGCFAGV